MTPYPFNFSEEQYDSASAELGAVSHRIGCDEQGRLIIYLDKGKAMLSERDKTVELSDDVDEAMVDTLNKIKLGVRQ